MTSKHALALVALLTFSIFSRAQQPEGSKVGDKIKYCLTCHGLDGGGFNGYYYMPRLAGQTPEYLEKQLDEFISHERDNPLSKQFMWSIAAVLTPDEITQISNFMSDLKAPPAGGGGTDHIAQGEMIFKNGVPEANVPACILCHQQNAQGIGEIPRLAGQGYLYIKRRLIEWREGYDPAAAPMPDYAKAMTEDQIEALAEYLSTIK